MGLISVSGLVASAILNLCIEARAGALGPFSPSFDINKHLFDCLAASLPENVHLMVIVQVLTTNLSTLLGEQQTPYITDQREA